MSLVFGTFMTFFTFLLFDNITKRSLWCKSRLLWHFWYFSSFCCLYKLVQACASLYKSKKVSCRFTDEGSHCLSQECPIPPPHQRATLLLCPPQFHLSCPSQHPLPAMPCLLRCNP